MYPPCAYRPPDGSDTEDCKPCEYFFRQLPSIAGRRAKMAQILDETPQLAAVAKENLRWWLDHVHLVSSFPLHNIIPLFCTPRIRWSVVYGRKGIYTASARWRSNEVM